MEKSKHEYSISSDIPVNELFNFINPINISLPINRADYHTIFKSSCDINKYVDTFYELLLKNIPSFNKENRDRFIKYFATISYTSHTSGYDFRFNPVDFFNSLFRFMRLDYAIPFINLDNGYGMNYLKDYVRAYINDFNRDDSQIKDDSYKQKKEVLNEINANLDTLVYMYYKNINNITFGNLIPKDMLLYLACASLNKYEKERDERYIILPCEYYHNISHMNTSAYPHKISVNGMRKWFNDFRNEYKNQYDPLSIVDDSSYILDDHEVLLAWDILKPGMLERQIRNTRDVVRATPNVDYEKYLKLFEVKMNYYMNSPYVNYIKGKYGLLGYMGFSYMNEYLLFDKFHNSDTIDPSKKTILTHAEAIYALPSDRFSVVKGSKQGIIKAKETDDRIKKVNHTPNYSFIGKLDDIITGPNVSYSTFDKVLEQEKKRMLIRK